MQIEVGSIVNGKITGITNFGAFVEIEGGKTGMVHISEVSSGFIKNITDILSVGQEVKCKILTISPEGKISLSIRKADEENDEPKPEQKQTYQRKDTRNNNPKVWQGVSHSAPSNEKQSFEDMMASFKKVSEEKMSDLKKADSKRGSVGYSRRGKN